jgi:glutamyl-tRNA synthetase
LDHPIESAQFRVRFAPSPTGYLHVGGARTALFNWLLAKRHGGTFVLRIEDTDAERSTDASVTGIFDGLRWLGIDWDEGPGVGGPYEPYFQAQRSAAHREMARQLIERGAAYYCYCSLDELKAKREAAEKAGGGWIYDRTCLNLSADEIARREGEGRPRAVRVRIPAGVMAFHDVVHGKIEFDGAHLEDFVIIRSDGSPTYNLSVVSDDVEMKISHVVRGDDHISNTPKQIVLYRAIGAAVPTFAHVPLILGPDKKRLSKRHGATSVTDYKAHGYLAEAMVNFLALLGWSPGAGDREMFTRDDLAAVFDLAGVSGGNAVFNTEKLDWFNQQYIARLDATELTRRLKPFFEDAGVWSDAYLGEKKDWFAAVLDQLRPRAKRLDEFAELGRFFFTDDLVYDQSAIEKYLKQDGMREHLEAVDEAFRATASFDAASLEAALRKTADARGVKAGTLIHAVRVALTGRTVSPGLFEVAALVGRDLTHARLAKAIAFAV